ncbi:MAG: (2Fe-2S)-binding protein, partial [Rhodobiaceae bacterium]|nr:(2Fe-2S)-binding protein [Rhodobiaceae bacterium]
MSGRPHRLADAALGGKAGRLVDTRRTLKFTFDGKAMTGHPGDTVASALLANGVRVIGRSFKYHRPRGLLGIGSEEPNGVLAIGRGNRMEPNVRATQAELFDGLAAQSQNRWPSLDFDVGALNQRFARLFPSGFYYKTFMWPRSFWKHVYEPVIRRAAGLGPAPSEADPDTYEQVHIHCDVLVVGGGVAGIAAAKAAMDAGARVIIADETARFGGMTDISGGTIEGADPQDWIRATVAELAASDRVHLLTRTTVSGHYDHNYAVMMERVADHDPRLLDKGAPRHRLWRVRAGEVVLATGAIERPLAFAENDRPGIMLSSAVRGYVARYGVTPGDDAVIVTNNDDAYRTAVTLFEAGVNVAHIVDARPDPDGPLIDMAKAYGIRMSFGSGIAGVVSDYAGKGVRAVKVAPMRRSGRVGEVKTIDCDVVANSGGWNPAVHLFCHTGGKLGFNDALASFVPGTTNDRIRAVGAANGTMDLPSILEEATRAGFEAARATVKKAGRAPKAPTADNAAEGPLQPVWFMPAIGPKNEGNKHFLDFQNDVTAADVELAVREGYRSVEHVKRYTTLGMATDQGKTSNLNGLALLAEATGRAIADVGTTTYRPPFTPVPFVSLNGPRRNSLLSPVRRLPLEARHRSDGAVFQEYGGWLRPACYGAGKAPDLIQEEARRARQCLALFDGSTLGKIEVIGPQAAEFVDFIYYNTMSSLKPGRCRYGFILSENGIVFDDGILMRVDENRFIVSCSSSHVAAVHARLEEWRQDRFGRSAVYIHNATSDLATLTVSGPRARDLLEKLDLGLDLDDASLPHMSLAQGHF